jgi:hypothetical protein
MLAQRLASSLGHGGCVGGVSQEFSGCFIQII